MKIVEVEPISIRSNFETVHIGGAHPRPLNLNSTLVRVKTDVGIEGVGESWLVYESEELLRSAIEHAVAPLLIGEDPRDVRGIFKKMWWSLKRSHGMARAVSAVDQALWDIKGKACGEPVYRLLGSASKGVMAYATTRQVHGTYAESLAAAAENGFKAVKMAAGRGVKEDVTLIEQAAVALEDRARFAVDANGKYTFAEARYLADAMADHKVLWFEEPVPHERFHDLGLLRQSALVPIAGFQEESTHYRMREYLQRDCLDVYNVSLAVCGGITTAAIMSGMLDAWGRALNPHGFGPPIMYAATLHVAVSSPTCSYIEFPVPDVSGEGSRDILWGGHMANAEDFSVNAAGMVEPPSLPGLGVELDEAFIDQNRLN